MIATRGGLVVLAVVAAILALVVAFGGPARRGPIDHALVPGLDVDRVIELTIERAGAGPGEGVALVRNARGWTARRGTEDHVTAQPASADALDALLSALRGARWHRRAGRRAAGATAATLAIGTATGVTKLELGQPLPGSAQTWLRRAGDAVLVDDWVVHALFPDALALADRLPLGDLARAHRIRFEAPGLPPLELADGRLGGVLVDAGLQHALAEAAHGLELVAVRATAPHEPAALTIDADEIWLAGGPPCDAAGTQIAVWGRRDAGCVAAARWHELVARVDALRGPVDQIVERRPVPAPPARVVLPGGAVLELARAPSLDGHEADPDRTGELVAALTAPAEPVARPRGAPTTTIVADGITLELFDHVIARRGEPVALRPSPQAWAAITRPAAVYRDPTRWLEDASTISAITIDRTTFRRGAVLGEWTGARDPQLLEALAAALAAVRAPAGPPPARVEHHVELAITPPAGPPATHHLAVGHPGPAGCAALADGTAVQLPLATCTAIAAAAR